MNHNNSLMSLLRLNDVIKKYKNNLTKIEFIALFNINLEIINGEILCILGPSGSGKTTLLRIISGIEAESSGTIELNGVKINTVDAQNRNMGFVFQDNDAIYPHLTVFENIAFPLRLSLRKNENRNILNEVNKILQKVDLLNKRDQYPYQLSGGERQRVALARSLVYNPKILLLDEPLNSLDNILKKEILDLIKHLHTQFNTTIIYVTHDEREALEIADRIVIMSDGKILQIGTVQSIVEAPEDSKVAKIIGGWFVFSAQYLITNHGYYILINNCNNEWTDLGFITNKEIEIGLPISKIDIVKTILNDAFLYIKITVTKIIYFQRNTVLEINMGPHSLRIEREQISEDFKKGEIAFLRIEKKQLRIW